MTDISRKNYILVIDALKCFDCKACMVACKVENNVPEGRWRNWVKPTADPKGRRVQFQPGQCMQCENPACVAACPVRATYKRSDGMVVIDPKKCIGCGNCVTGCPYGARFRNPETKPGGKVRLLRTSSEYGGKNRPVLRPAPPRPGSSGI